MHAWLGVGEAEALEERKGGFVGADLAAWQPDGRALFPCLLPLFFMGRL